MSPAVLNVILFLRLPVVAFGVESVPVPFITIADPDTLPVVTLQVTLPPTLMLNAPLMTVAPVVTPHVNVPDMLRSLDSVYVIAPPLNVTLYQVIPLVFNVVAAAHIRVLLFVDASTVVPAVWVKTPVLYLTVG